MMNPMESTCETQQFKNMLVQESSKLSMTVKNIVVSSSGDMKN